MQGLTYKNEEDQSTTINFNNETKNQQKKVKFNGNIEDYYMVDYFDEMNADGFVLHSIQWRMFSALSPTSKSKIRK